MEKILPAIILPSNRFKNKKMSDALVTVSFILIQGCLRIGIGFL